MQKSRIREKSRRWNLAEKFLALAWVFYANLALANPAARILPGLQPNGFTRLHNQQLINPVGDQVALGDFPVNLAIHRSGRYAAVLHAGYGKHEVRVVDLKTKRIVAIQPLTEAFYGLTFSPDGKRLLCSGGSDEVLHVFAFHAGALQRLPDVRIAAKEDHGVLAGLALSPDGRAVAVSVLFNSKLVCLDLSTGKLRWTSPLGEPAPDAVRPRSGDPSAPPNEGAQGRSLAEEDNPLAVVWDARRSRIYASLWGTSYVVVLDATDGHLIARWDAGLHPNELMLSSDGDRLFVSNGGFNTVTIMDADTGKAIETLRSSLAPDDLPGSTPDSLALTPDGHTLFVANANNNNIAVFDVSKPGQSLPLGFIPTGWMPSSVRVTPNGGQLLVVSARGVEPKSNGEGSPSKFTYIGELYRGSLGIIDLPKTDELPRALAGWTQTAQRCRPAPAPDSGLDSGNPIPIAVGGVSPIRHVIYIIKENRTYDQVFGDLSEGNGDPSLCLFPEEITPNIHALARDFVLLDNFYVNAEVSASGHEWSMGAYASEFVEKTWPVNYGHLASKVPYTGEGHFAAALPAMGYLWDRAAAAGVSYRSYAEFANNGPAPADPVTTALPALRGHVDLHYRCWDQAYRDIDRAARFIEELHRFERIGDMPRLQIMRLPQDHTAAATAGAWTPQAMVADNDVALGRIVEAVSRSRFWPDTAIFVIEDDAQDGADHVDAHRTEALVISPWCRHGAVDSTPYTTCSMLRTIELILGLEPMSQYDAAATLMRASFEARPQLSSWAARPARVDLDKRNPNGTPAARVSATFNLSREDAVDEQAFNRVLWAVVRGEDCPVPPPVHAAFVHSLLQAFDNDD
jgi:DNA-binding beta-propeller fold protein YncE